MDRDCAVEEVATHVPRPPELDVGDSREAFHERFGLAEVLGQREPCFRPTQSSLAVATFSAHGRLPGKGAGAGRALASTDARLGECAFEKIDRNSVSLALTPDV